MKFIFKNYKILRKWFKNSPELIIILSLLVNNLGTDLYKRYVGAHINPTKTEEKKDEIQNKKVAGLTTCIYLICEDFTNTENWIGIGRFEIIQKKPLTLRPLISNIGSVMYNERLVPVPSTLILEFIPNREESNTFIRYKDLFDYIIGDAGTTRVAVKNGDKYIFPVGYSKGHFDLGDGFKKGELVKVKLKISESKFGKVKIQSWITYTNETGLLRESMPIPDFEVSISNKNINEYSLGIGLLQGRSASSVESILKTLILDTNK